jgi:hypothetical protein
MPKRKADCIAAAGQSGRKQAKRQKAKPALNHSEMQKPGAMAGLEAESAISRESVFADDGCAGS